MTEKNIKNAIFPKGEKGSSEYFTGNTWVNYLVLNSDTFNTLVLSVVFEPGARNYWHTHPGGQILLVTEGTGYYQEKGKSIQILQVGDVVTIAPDVAHWHGASPDSVFTHIAINTNTHQGIVDWLQEVSDEEYNGLV